MTDTQTCLLALIGFVKTAGGFLQTKLRPLGGAIVDFYTVDLYFILLSRS